MSTFPSRKCAATPEAEAVYAAIEPREVTLIQMQNQILALAEENPRRMAELVQVWVREPAPATAAAAGAGGGAARRPLEADHGRA